MVKKLNLKLFNPSGLQLETEIESVYFETLAGQVGILPQHTTYVSALGTGLLEFKNGSESTRRCVISEGFCEVSNDVVSVLADSIDFPDQIKLNDLEEQKLEINKVLQNKETAQSEILIYQRKLARIQACQKLLSN